MKERITSPSTRQSLIQLCASSLCPCLSQGLFSGHPSAAFSFPPLPPFPYSSPTASKKSSLLVPAIQLMPLSVYFAQQSKSSARTQMVTHSNPSSPLHRSSPFTLPHRKYRATFLNTFNSNFEGGIKKDLRLWH